MPDVGADRGEERLRVADPLGLGQHGQGRGRISIHLGRVEHAVAAREHPGPAAILRSLVGVLLLLLVADLPEHHGAGTLALADLRPQLGPLPVGRPYRARVALGLRRRPKHDGVDAPVWLARGRVDRQHRRCPVRAGVPRHPPLARPGLDGGGDLVGDALVDVGPACPSRPGAVLVVVSPISLSHWLRSSASLARCFPGPRERWGWRGKSGFAGTRLHGAGALRGGGGSWVEAALGERRGKAPRPPLRRVRGDDARQR